MAADDQQTSESAAPATKLGGAYSHYVLFVLVIVYVFNFIDRNILSILSQDIQADLGVSDAEMGFLYGTVFAVFYAVFGIPLARFADVWVRRSLISLGLVFWSAMTALSGFARSFLCTCAVSYWGRYWRGQCISGGLFDALGLLPAAAPRDRYRYLFLRCIHRWRYWSVPGGLHNGKLE